MKQNYCYVLEYTSATINCIHLQNGDKKPEDFETQEDLIKHWGFNPDNCNWMITDEDLEINDVYSPLK